MKLVSILVLLACSTLPGTAKPGAEARPPNVLLIAIDDLNDWVGCLSTPERPGGGGHPDAKTPHIDRLAKRGMRLFWDQCERHNI